MPSNNEAENVAYLTLKKVDKMALTLAVSYLNEADVSVLSYRQNCDMTEHLA